MISYLEVVLELAYFSDLESCTGGSLVVVLLVGTPMPEWSKGRGQTKEKSNYGVGGTPSPDKAASLGSTAKNCGKQTPAAGCCRQSRAGALTVQVRWRTTTFCSNG